MLEAKKSDVKFSQPNEYEIDIKDIHIRPNDKNVLIASGEVPLDEPTWNAIRKLLQAEIPKLANYKSCYIATWNELGDS